MKKRCLVLISLLISLHFVSCKKEKAAVSYDYFIFGRFYGMCGGEECVEIYKLENGQLFEDTKDQYPGSQTFYQGSYVQRSQQDYDLAKDITDYFPDDLLNETDIVIGQPDAGDWGGHYIELKSGTTHRFWLLDKMKSNVDSKYHLFIDKLNEKIDSLK